MNSVSEKYDALIKSYLDGQCSQDEALELLSWIAESDENRTYFESFKEVWHLTDFALPEVLDVDAALDAVNTKIDALEEEIQVVQMPWLRRNYKYVSGIAASVVVALFMGFLVSRSNPMVTLASNDWDSETAYTLPDGTSVAFNGVSEISHPKHFAKGERAINFEGKAYFDVVKDESKPFVIHCGSMDVEVLGTSFLLDADKNDNRYLLDLYTGKVRMTAFDQKGRELSQIEINPGERGVLNVAEGALKAMTYPEVKEEELLNDRVLDFNNVSLSTIVETLEYIYQVKIDLDESCASKKLTARFTDEDSVDEVIETIAAVFDFTVTKTDGVYRIR